VKIFVSFFACASASRSRTVRIKMSLDPLNVRCSLAVVLDLHLHNCTGITVMIVFSTKACTTKPKIGGVDVFCHWLGHSNAITFACHAAMTGNWSPFA